MVILVPKDEGLRELIMTLAHGTGGYHAHSRTTAAMIKNQYYWDGLPRDVDRFVDNCMVCKMVKDPTVTRAPRGITRVSFGPFTLLGRDFADMQTESLSGYRYLLVIIDIFSIHIRLVPCQNIDAEEAAAALVQYGADYLDPL